MSIFCSQFKCQTLLFEKLIGPYQVLPLRAMGAVAMKGYSAFPKASALQEPQHLIV